MKLEDIDVTTLAPGDWLVIDATSMSADDVVGMREMVPADLRSRTLFLGVEHSVVHVDQSERLAHPPRLEDIEPMDTAETYPRL